ncbi:GNAT family N-acetyltransferase [Alkalicoccus urumqiensis]|uniref:GNAT family N-acetyltransferase n=1 Tax=Alkalicoccus urumqiensis TaxID=1548213 RepID=A0A2P6MET3_ALKUR|nr:GNAT family N-acetyltransferase [Alkalicoccus urumqiensis]PRO64788.1 GNAT family N-acetyltransferase [Alkalicoccus urumqiensis]
MIQIFTAETKEQLSDCYRVRREVFVGEQGVPASIEVDNLEHEAVHFVVYDDGKAIGAARMRLSENTAKAERVCILSQLRGSGAGRKLMRFMEEKASELGAEIMKLNAQTHAAPFYTAVGYSIVSEEPFMDAGIEHVAMEKKLQ